MSAPLCLRAKGDAPPLAQRRARASTGTAAEADITKPSDGLVAGKPLMHLTNVSKPTLAVYPPTKVPNTGAAVVVFPGGGYRILAYDLEGTEVCTWLNSIGVTCVLAKYRVPFADHYPENAADLEDAQQAMRITRSHAAEWHIDPHRIGVLGFSAGAHLAVVLSNHADHKRAGAPARSRRSTRAPTSPSSSIPPIWPTPPHSINSRAASTQPPTPRRPSSSRRKTIPSTRRTPWSTSRR